MAGEFTDSNHSSSLTATDLYTTTHNPIAYDSAFTDSWHISSSSLLTTQFKSELDSSNTHNDDDDVEDEFILELTRRMEDYRLQEDDDDNNIIHNNTRVECSVSHNSIPKVKNQNQHRVVVNSKRGRGWKMTESTQQMKYGRVSQVGYRRMTSSGSGMRAVFLNRSGSKTGCKGTGVFLPPSANDPTAQTRRITGYSAALVPTRVLRALEQHFNNLKSLSSLNGLLQTEPTHKDKEVSCNKSRGGGRH